MLRGRRGRRDERSNRQEWARGAFWEKESAARLDSVCDVPRGGVGTSLARATAALECASVRPARLSCYVENGCRRRAGGIGRMSEHVEMICEGCDVRVV